MAHNTKPVTWGRLPLDLLTQIEDAAERNDRSMSAELRTLVREGLRARAANDGNGK
jgi:hypothetical protein